MPETQNPNDPEYDWLYSGRQGPPPSPSPAPAPQPQEAPPEPTRILEVPPRPGPRPAPAAQPQAGYTPQSPPQSFGGTFTTPPQSGSRFDTPAPPGPRFATPAQTDTRGSQPPRPPLGSSSPTPPAPPRKNRRRWWVRAIVIVVVAWLVFLVVVPIWAWQKISKVSAEPTGQRPSATAGTTYLLVGSDSRQGLTKQQKADLGTGAAAGQRTDTIILLHVPGNGGPTLLLSIPRDSYVDIPGHGKNKINAAYAFGGPQLLVKTIEQATNVRVDDYIEVGFAGFVDVVDAVGGIRVCPDQAINDPKAGHLKMRKGCQDVDGHTALDYSRSRDFANGDITRALHHREVITAVGAKAASWQTVVFPWRYLSINAAAANSLHVGENVGPIALARFGWAMAHSGGTNAKRCVVPYTSLGTSTSAGSVVTWDEKLAKALFQAVRDDDTSGINCTPTGR